MQFVNLRGEPVLVPLEKTPAKKAAAPQPDSFHKGWIVAGFSPAQLATAKLEHEKAQPGKPFDPVSYMRVAKPVKARSKPYEIHDAAEQCAEMLRRAGWLLVSVVAKAKGGKE